MKNDMFKWNLFECQRIQGLHHIENVGAGCYLYNNPSKQPPIGCAAGDAQPGEFPKTDDYLFKLTFEDIFGRNMVLKTYLSNEYVFIDAKS